LPGFGYEGDDPDGYRTMPEVIDFIDRYAKVISAPVPLIYEQIASSANRNDAGAATERQGIGKPHRSPALGIADVVR